MMRSTAESLDLGGDANAEQPEIFSKPTTSYLVVQDVLLIDWQVKGAEISPLTDPELEAELQAWEAASDEALLNYEASLD